MQSISLLKPDDWHCHLRDKQMLNITVPASAQHFSRVIVMPNLPTPVTTCQLALAYRQRIITAAQKARISFNPLMTLYLTDQTTINDIKATKDHDSIVAVKLYPAGATTLSSAGVKHIQHLYPIFDAMQEIDMPLLIHGEVVDATVDIFEREQRFIETTLAPLVDAFPRLRVVLEHITTRDAVQFVQHATKNVAATITIHHLLLNRNDLLAGGIRPHYYCLPILKAQQHQHALQQAALSGNPSFFLGTDSAPHQQHKKESACGCAGIFTAPVAMALYTTFFAEHNALDKLEHFSSRFGAEFYQMPINSDYIHLDNVEWTVPETIAIGNGEHIIPFYAGKSLQWQVRS